MKGNMAAFIDNFLSHRTFTVQHGNASSDLYKQETRVPQGSILSVTLFILKINCITESFSTGIEKFLYVDDFAITYSSPNMPTLERQMQNCLNKINQWKWLPILKNKNCQHTLLQKTNISPRLRNIDGHTIPVVQQSKYLGIIFINKLNFKAHIEYLLQKCLNDLKFLKISEMKWGADC